MFFWTFIIAVWQYLIFFLQTAQKLRIGSVRHQKAADGFA